MRDVRCPSIRENILLELEPMEVVEHVAYYVNEGGVRPEDDGDMAVVWVYQYNLVLKN